MSIWRGESRCDTLHILSCLPYSYTPEELQVCYIIYWAWGWKHNAMARKGEIQQTKCGSWCFKNGTLMRKSCTTAVHNHNRKVKGSVVAYMAHSKYTAYKNYHLVQKRGNSDFPARQLVSIMHESWCSERKVDPESYDEHDLTPSLPLQQTWTEEHEAVQDISADLDKPPVSNKERYQHLGRPIPCLKQKVTDKIRGLCSTQIRQWSNQW